MKTDNEIKILTKDKIKQAKLAPYLVSAISIFFIYLIPSLNNAIFKKVLPPTINVLQTTLLSMIAFLMLFGVVVYFLELAREKKLPGLSTVFIGLVDHAFKTIGTYLLMGLVVLGFSILLVVPGIIKLITYIFVPHVLNDNPTLSPAKVLKATKELTNGHKGRIFTFIMSYVPLIIIGLLCIVIGLQNLTTNAFDIMYFIILLVGVAIMTIVSTRYNMALSFLYVEICKDYQKSNSRIGSKKKINNEKTYREKIKKK